MAVRHFVFELNGRPHALARVDAPTTAERLMRGGDWETMPRLMHIAGDDNMDWDELTAAEARKVEGDLRSTSKVG